MKQNNYGRILAGLGAALGWFALISQFILIIPDEKSAMPETIVRYFSYFTILSNIMVALCLSSALLPGRSASGKFLTRPAVVSAVMLYILTTGLIYNTVLRPLSDLHGFQRLVDELLHLVIPLLFVFYWIFFVPKPTLTWKNIGQWAAFPALYCCYSLIRGAIVGYYPYPFFNVTRFGYQQILLNCATMVLLFVILAVVLVAVSKRVSRTDVAKD